ncbi:hypothetical protein Ae201684P_012368 [Aphanomyces euteiches]|nr:hypothetical protein Ae201684P_012368 [Aphanomyces euteiches]
MLLTLVSTAGIMISAGAEISTINQCTAHVRVVAPRLETLLAPGESIRRRGAFGGSFAAFTNELTTATRKLQFIKVEDNQIAFNVTEDLDGSLPMEVDVLPSSIIDSSVNCSESHKNNISSVMSADCPSQISLQVILCHKFNQQTSFAPTRPSSTKINEESETIVAPPPSTIAPTIATANIETSAANVDATASTPEPTSPWLLVAITGAVVIAAAALAFVHNVKRRRPIPRPPLPPTTQDNIDSIKAASAWI